MSPQRGKHSCSMMQSPHFMVGYVLSVMCNLRFPKHVAFSTSTEGLWCLLTGVQSSKYLQLLQSDHGLLKARLHSRGFNWFFPVSPASFLSIRKSCAVPSCCLEPSQEWYKSGQSGYSDLSAFVD